ncbi:hypothetical protein [Burkholderia sp. ZZQ-2]|uniref:hypothetical protein n=1 Tax=Burkholderia sp. ZZQ-2 TaxID=1661766 RepID=UPI003D6EFD88
MNDGETLFANVIAFSSEAKAALLGLDDGDSVALAGTLTPKVWTDRIGEAKPALDMVANAVLTAYHVKRKRATMQGGSRGDEDWNDRPPINEPGRRRRLATASAVSDTDFFTRRPNEGPRNTMPKLIGQSRPKPLLPMEVA